MSHLFADDSKQRADVKVRDTYVAGATTEQVDELCRDYHYAQHAGADTWRYGLWHEYDLLGVVTYNKPTGDAGAALFGWEHAQQVLHMGRLVMHDDTPPNSESRLIVGSLRLLQRDVPDALAVLTFSDPDQIDENTGMRQVGLVYQATNALYTGEGGQAVFYYDPVQQRRMATSHISRTQAEAKGWQIHRGMPKHRYVYLLGGPAQRRQLRERLQLPVLADQQNPGAYPKPRDYE